MRMEKKKVGIQGNLIFIKVILALQEYFTLFNIFIVSTLFFKII